MPRPNNFVGLAGGGDKGRARKRVPVPSGTADANIRFEDLRSLLRALGFTERIKGDHHIYSKDGVIEILNLQPPLERPR